MTPIQLAPIGGMSDVCATPEGWLAIVRADADVLLLVWLDRAGHGLLRAVIHTGNAADNTFPRAETVVIDGVARQFVAYPAYRADAWHAMLREVTGGVLGDELPGGGVHSSDRNGGNNSVCLSPDGWFAWQDDNTRCVEGVNLRTGEQRTLRAELRPTGLASCDGGQVVFVDEARMSIAGMANPVTSGTCTVGESPTGGIAVQLASGQTGVLLPGADTNVPRCADGGDGTFVAITWGKPGPAVQFLVFTAADVVALPAPTFTIGPFNHDVLVVVFKDPAGASGAPAEIVVNQTGQSAGRPYFVAEDSLAGPFRGELLGIYSEAPMPTTALALAAQHGTRLLLGHDAQTEWVIPAGLRPWDVPAIELYLLPNETPAQSAARWVARVQVMLAAWPGDCAVIAGFYCGGGAPPNEMFTVAQVLAGLGYLTPIVNLSPRITIVAPFSFLRENGITRHPELRAAFDSLLRATPGRPTLTPVGTSRPVPAPSPKPIPKPVPAPSVPSPVPAPTFLAHARTFGGPMKVFLLFGGRYVGISPTAIPHQIGDAQFLPYHDREKGGGWEGVELTKHDDGSFDARFLDSDRQLSVNNNGGLESRSAGTDGPWERLHAVTLPEQPTDGSRGILYRTDDAGHILGTPLTIEAAE